MIKICIFKINFFIFYVKLKFQLDVFSEKNNNFHEIIKLRNNPYELEQLKNKIKLLKQENNKIKKKLIAKYENDIIKPSSFTLENFKNENSGININIRSISHTPKKK